MSTPIGPPSCAAALSSRVDQIDNYVFEWNRTLASRVRNALLAESNQLENAVEVSLNLNNQSYQFSIVSRDINFSSRRRNASGSGSESNENKNRNQSEEMRMSMRNRNSHDNMLNISGGLAS